MMPKQYNKTTILFGAGAVLDWHAPSTCKLTEIILNSGYFITDNQTRITKFIYDSLIELGDYQKYYVNFETILNVIEELIVHYSYQNAETKTKSFHQVFFDSSFEEQLLNFSVSECGIDKRYKLNIPKGIDDDYASTTNSSTPPEQHFFQCLLKKLLTKIQLEVSKYAYHTISKSEVLCERNAGNNLLFSNWINKAIGNGSLRMYTLNYDRLFKVILENSTTPLTIFEGFDCESKIDYNAKIPSNIQKILSDTDSHIHYNLHGSAFWRIDTRDVNHRENPKFYLTTNINLEENQSSSSNYQSEVGKNMLLTNIITGYQKTQKSILSPFKQMQASFDRDCCFSDTVYIIGYSFNDEHINAGIKASIQSGSSTKFVIVDPGFKNNNFDVEVFKKIFFNAGGVPYIKNLTNNIHSFYDDKFLVYAMTFVDFMNFKMKQRWSGDYY